ncbi:MAG: M14 family metallopeptidase [Pseudoxanthomonas sp.]
MTHRLLRPALAALVALLALLPSAVPAAGPAQDRLQTESERSRFLRTGRFDEVIALCARFQAAFPDAVRCSQFGRTPEGRPMLALIASRSGTLDASEAHRRGVPVLLVQGGIHAGEIDGKDAGFLALREVLQGKAAPGALEHQVLVFVPVFNIDGHERFGRWNRPNQRGPEEMGWRTTGQNYNLNRDYAKADTPEMQAMLGLVNTWDPIATIDLHVTDGAKFRHDVSIQVEPLHAGDPGLRAAGTAFRDGVMADLRSKGSLPLAVYPSFITYDDPSSGIADGVSSPRFSTGYFWLRNRFGMLVETHSWKDYPTRVRITRNTVVSVLEQVASHGQDWLRLANAADASAAASAGRPVELEYGNGPHITTIDFLGYAYTRTPSEISGALMTRYDETRPELWKMPVHDQIVPTLTQSAPRAGYLVAAAHADWVAARLAAHGISFRKLKSAPGAIDLQAFRASSVALEANSFEGHQRAKIAGEWANERRQIGAGALFVPIAQPKAQLVMTLLEPKASDSYAAWGEFNNAWEQKEYMEAYVAEEVARDQLRASPELRAQFESRLASDKAFAANPQARLEFFARRHSSWDERYMLYPVFRLDTPPD